MQDSLAEHVAQLEQQQRALAQLSQEMRVQLEQQQVELEKHRSETEEKLAKKKDRIEGHILEKPPLYQVIITLIFLAVMGILLLILLYRLISHLPPNRMDDALTIIGTLLTLTGGLYLAYDILESRNRLLVQLTTYTTYALIGIIVITPLVWFILLFDKPPDSYAHAARGLFLGGITGGIGGALMLLMRDTLNKLRFFSLKTWLVDLFLSCLLLLALASYDILTNRSVRKELPFEFLGTLILIIIATVLLHCLRYFVGDKLSHTQTKAPLFYWRGFLVAFVIWWLMWSTMFILSFAGLLQSIGVLLVVGITVSTVLALAGAITSGIARFVLVWANSLAGRTLGIFGLCFASVGIVLVGIPPVLHLVSA